jgi:hypothetical protein
MMRDSPDRLANAFVAAVENGMKDDWSFEIAAAVTVKEPEHWRD